MATEVKVKVKTKTISDIERADAFFDAVMKYKEKIEKTENEINSYGESEKYEAHNEGEAKAMEALAGLEDLSDTQKEMVDSSKVLNSDYAAREKLIAQKEKYIESVAALEGQIRIAISKYIVDTEKEQKKLEKNKEKYAAYVEEEKAKAEALKTEISEMDKDDVTYEDKCAELETLTTRIEKMNEKLASFDESLAKITDELNKNKEKYKDYIKLAKEDLEAPEAEEKTAEKTDKDASEVVADGKKESKKVEENNKTRAASKENKDGAVYAVASEEKEEKKEEKTAEEKTEEKKEETDKQAFKRIYKQLRRKETLSVEDTNKMLDLLNNKSNFSKLNIQTETLFLFTRSKGQKLYTSLGKELERQIKEAVGDKELSDTLKTVDLVNWKRIIEFGNNNPTNNIEEVIDEALKTADEDKIAQLLEVKGRFEKFSDSAKILTTVKRERGEISYKALPAKKVETKTDVEVEAPKEAPKGLENELSSMVKSEAEIAREEATHSDTREAVKVKVVKKTTEDKTI